MKATLIGLLLLVSLTTYTQKGFHVTAKPGFAFTGLHKDLEDAMTSSGFNDNSWYGNTKHPFTDRPGLGMIVELEIKARDKVSYSLAGGLTDWGEVLGYDQIGGGQPFVYRVLQLGGYSFV